MLDSTAVLRNTQEAKEIDQNVQQFQTRQRDEEKERRKKRFSALSSLYSDDSWESPRNSRSNPLDDLAASSPPTNDPMLIENANPQSNYEQLSPREITLLNDPKGDDPLNKDEGFDSESMSDPSASQRTSMSSTLDSELTGKNPIVNISNTQNKHFL